jgi:hypothetical protein
MAVNPGSISSQPAAATLTGAELLPLDQDVGSPVLATALTVGQGYRIATLGNTNWQTVGAGASAAVSTVFRCEAVGTGTGTAQRVDTRRVTAQGIAARALQDPTAAPTFAGLTVTGTATAAQFDGNLTGAVSSHCRNASGGALAALTPLNVTGSQGDTTILEVVAARSDTPGRMPAAGLALAALGTSGSAANGHLVSAGPIAGVNTAGLTSGAPLFVAAAGGITATRPTTGLVQVVAVVGRVHAIAGTVVVGPGPALSLAAFSGAYGDLLGRPTLGSAAAAETTDFDPAGAASGAITAHLMAASHHAPASLAASLQTVFGLSGQELGAQSPGADLTRLYYWNPATSRLEFLALGTGLSIASGQLNAATGGSAFDIQVFTSSGTWTKPPNALLCEVWISGGGGGGGSARVGAAGTDRGGGGGASSAAGVYIRANASRFNATEAAVIGAAGLGGTEVTTPDTSGNAGTNGGSTTFAGITAVGGLAGGGGTTTGGTAGAARTNCCFNQLFDTATTSTAAGTAGVVGGAVALSGNSTGIKPGPGAGGSGITSANARGTSGAASGLITAIPGTIFPSSGLQGSGDGANGANGTFIQFFGVGGGGGNAHPTGDGGRGGDGISYGAGGGGGGAGLNGFVARRGGNGGPGIVVVITQLSS